MDTTPFYPEQLFVFDNTSKTEKGHTGAFDIINRAEYVADVKAIGTVHPYGKNGFCTHDEAKAYAKLFAASPDMLKALQLALKIKDLWAPVSDPGVEHEGEAQALQSMLTAFETAIAKATQ